MKRQRPDGTYEDLGPSRAEKRSNRKRTSARQIKLNSVLESHAKPLLTSKKVLCGHCGRQYSIIKSREKLLCNCECDHCGERQLEEAPKLDSRRKGRGKK